MPLQLRVLATGQLFEVPNEGQSIGREGGQADIQLKDAGLSSRHARIFADGSQWLIQDMGSTNGTYLGEVRVGTATEIHPDDVITMSATKLEVLKVWDPELQRTMMMPAPIFDTVPSRQAVSRTPVVAKGRAPAVVSEEEEQEPSAAPTMIGQAGQSARTMIGYGAPAPAVEEPPIERREFEDPDPGAEAGAEAEASGPPGGDKGLKYFLVAVPKAIAFYLAAIPLMIVNPIGSIRKGVEEQKHEAKEKMELIAYALPVNLFSAAVGFLATLIVQLVTGTLSVGGLIIGMLVIPAIVAVVVSAITGFVWHPVTAWIVTKLKGESDARSRTNYFLMFMTASALVALPSGIGTILGLVPFRLVAMVQPALSALGSVVLIFVTYSWMTKFNVVKWFRTVLLVLGGLAIVGGAFGMLGRLTTAPAGRGVGVAGTSAADVEAQVAAAQKQADVAQQAVADATGEAKAAAKEGDSEVKAVAAIEPDTAAPSVAGPKVTYPAYVQMRDSVEKVIADDPALLNRSPELLALYHQYTTATFEVDAKFNALNEKNPADAKLNVRLRDAEVFTKTEKSVSALYAKLNPSGKANADAPRAAVKEEKATAEAKPAPVAKEEKPKPAPVAKEEKPKPEPVAKAEAKPAPVAKEEKAKPAPVAKAEAKPAPVAKEEKAKPAPVAKEEKPVAAAKAPAGKGKLACSSKPTQADIWVDGKNTGKKTPLAVSSALELPSGKHTVLFKLNGKASAPVEINVEPGGQVVLKGVEIPGA